MSSPVTSYERETSGYTSAESEGYESAVPESRYLTESPGYRRGLSGWKIAGLALGIVGFFYFEPDLRRYLKIRSM
jgi:hypothetical protein